MNLNPRSIYNKLIEFVRRDSANEKADFLLSQVKGAVDGILPENVIIIANDDKPWFNWIGGDGVNITRI